MALGDRLRDDAQALSPDLVRLRHTLHQTPEIGLRLPMTQETVLRKLDGLGLEVTTGEQLSSVTASYGANTRAPRSCCAQTWTLWPSRR